MMETGLQNPVVVLGPCVFGEFGGFCLGAIATIVNLHMGSILEGFLLGFMFTMNYFLSCKLITRLLFWDLFSVWWKCSGGFLTSWQQ